MAAINSSVTHGFTLDQVDRMEDTLAQVKGLLGLLRNVHSESELPTEYIVNAAWMAQDALDQIGLILNNPHERR